MKLKELFKMVEQSNKLAELMDDKKKYIEFSYGIASYEKFTSYKAFKSFIKAELVTPIEVYNELELQQNEDYKNCFKGTHIFKSISGYEKIMEDGFSIYEER